MEEQEVREGRKRRRESETPPGAGTPRGVGRFRRSPAAAEDYVYLPIPDAVKAAGARVCLFAAVSEVGAAVQSRGTDFSLTLKIVDQFSATTGISVTFFADNTALLPCVRCSGDVISLHNVVVTMHDADFFVAYSKKRSSFALFEGKISTDCTPYQTSMNYRGSNHDCELLTQMRTWLVYHPPGLREFELQIRTVKADSVFDLICEVLHVRETSRGEWIMYVWDGTDTPPVEFQTEGLDIEAVSSSPLHLDEEPLPREVLCTFPCVGTVLRVFANKFLKEVPHLQKSVCWAKLCNITCKLEGGIWKGVLLPSSRVRLLSPEDGNVVDRLKMYRSRITTRVHCQPMASLPKASEISVIGEHSGNALFRDTKCHKFDPHWVQVGVPHSYRRQPFRTLTRDIDYGKAGYSTLMESLTHEQVAHKFKTLVRVVAAYPWQASDLRSPLTGNYCVRLTLEDPTARIHAYVHKEDGIEFFGGFPTADTLTSKMNKLLGIPEDAAEKESTPLTRNPPWIWCCLKSYRLDKNDPWGSRRYRIFGTKIKD